MAIKRSDIYSGFPSPADDFLESSLDLNRYLISDLPATVFIRVSGYAMRGLGFFRGDILVVNRSLPAKSNSFVIANIEGELLFRKLVRCAGGWGLQAASSRGSYYVKDFNELVIWGVVIGVVRKLGE